MSTFEHERQSTLVIRPPGRWPSIGFRDLWRYRELLLFLTWRDVKVRYKQTVLGAAWALIQPLMTMVVFTVVFNRFGNIKADVPYPLFALSGLALWFYFSNSVNVTSGNLVGNAALITKVYFPRLAIAISPLLSGLVDFGLALVVVAGAMAYYGFAPPPQIVLMPVFVGLALLTALGIGLVLSAANVRYRDVRYAVPFMMQIWLYLSPVAYPSSLVGTGLRRTIYSLNPMTGVIDGFRWSLLGSGHLRPEELIVSTLAAAVLLAVGLVYFARTERTFADVV
jgi:homopolymeric O-antigen transport system permease protein